MFAHNPANLAQIFFFIFIAALGQTSWQQKQDMHFE